MKSLDNMKSSFNNLIRDYGNKVIPYITKTLVPNFDEVRLGLGDILTSKLFNNRSYDS